MIGGERGTSEPITHSSTAGRVHCFSQKSPHTRTQGEQLCGGEGQSSVTGTGGEEGAEKVASLTDEVPCGGGVCGRVPGSGPPEGPGTPHRLAQRGPWANDDTRARCPPGTGISFHIFMIQPGSVSLSSVPQDSKSQASLLLNLIIIIIRKYNSQLLGKKIF